MRRVLAVLFALVGLSAGTLHFVDSARLSAAPAAAQAGLFIQQSASVDTKFTVSSEWVLITRHLSAHRNFIASGVTIAALLALVLTLRPLGRAGAILRDSLAIGAASLGFVLAWYPWIALQGVLPATINLTLVCTAMAGSMVSLWLFGRFAANYPQAVSDTDLPEREFEWYWGRLFREARERGISRTRAVLDDIKRGFDWTVFRDFMRTGKGRGGATPSSKLLDRELHRMLQGRAFLVGLCVVIVACTLIAAGYEKGDLAATLALGGIIVLWALLPAFVYLPACMHYWEIGYARGDDTERRTIRWMLASIYLAVVVYFAIGIVILVPMMTIGFGTGFDELFAALFMVFIIWLFPGAWFLLLLAIAASIFLRGAVEPALVLKRSVLYGIVVVTMTIVFVTMENLLQSEAVARLGLPEQATIVITGTLVALVLGPLRDRIERRVTAIIDGLLPEEP